MKQKDKILLKEAVRRMSQFGHNIDSDFLGLGYPSEYKSVYFIPSFGKETPKVLNWYKLSEQGKKYFEKQPA